jgi:hypothetical protein
VKTRYFKGQSCNVGTVKILTGDTGTKGTIMALAEAKGDMEIE